MAVVHQSLPAFVGFEKPDDLTLMREISEKAHAVTITPYEDGVHPYILINYFEELITEEARTQLEVSPMIFEKLSSAAKDPFSIEQMTRMAESILEDALNDMQV